MHRNNYILDNGVQIPIVGMGTWPLRGNELESIMSDAIDIGYRLFDTADNYFNEESVGNVIAKNKKIREELFVVTKISDEKSRDINRWSSIGKYFYKTSPYMKNHSVEEIVNDLVYKSLRKLQTDYIDCLLMHWPYPDYFLEIWDAMIELYKKGDVRSIGVSNCRQRHLELIKKSFSIKPMVNQICVSPIDTRETLIRYCVKENIRPMCYAPLQMQRHPDILNSADIRTICQNHDISICELLLAWNHLRGIIPIPKSSKFERLKQNYNLDSVKLTPKEILSINALNKDIQYLAESKYCPGL